MIRHFKFNNVEDLEKLAKKINVSYPHLTYLVSKPDKEFAYVEENSESMDNKIKLLIEQAGGKPID